MNPNAKRSLLSILCIAMLIGESCAEMMLMSGLSMSGSGLSASGSNELTPDSEEGINSASGSGDFSGSADFSASGSGGSADSSTSESGDFSGSADFSTSGSGDSESGDFSGSADFSASGSGDSESGDFSGSADFSASGSADGIGVEEPSFNVSLVCQALMSVNRTVERAVNPVNIEISLPIEDSVLSDLDISVFTIEELTPSNITVSSSIVNTTLRLGLLDTFSLDDNVTSFEVFLTVEQLNTSMSGVCSFNISITFQVADICNLGSTLMPIESSAVQRATFTLEFDIAIGLVDNDILTLIQEIFSMEFTAQCSSNCAGCNLASICTEYFQSCGGFQPDDINIGRITSGGNSSPTSDTVNVNKRQTDNSSESTVIEFFVTIPSGASSLLTDLSFPLIPALSAVVIVTSTTDEIENTTGVAVIGLPEALVVFPTATTTATTAGPNSPMLAPIAVIVLPILVVGAVLAMVVGIVIMVLVVYVIKAKKRTKVLPTSDLDDQQPTQGLRNYAEVGHGAVQEA